MKITKHVVLFVLVFTGVVALIGAQTGQSGGTLSVEESYLQQSIEMMMINEQMRAPNMDSKKAALDLINEEIQNGNTSDSIRASLEYLGIEGTINQTRENGRLMNNYPEIRVQAATYLGQLKTKEAHDSLMKMLIADDEPWVLTEVVKSLGTIGMDDNGETVNAIRFVFSRFDALNPNDLLADATLDTFVRLAQASGNVSPYVVQMVMNISDDGRYNYIIRNKAKQTVDTLRRLSVQSR